MERDLFDFRNIGYNLLNNSDDAFERFFEKLYRIDRAYLYIYLLTHRAQITESQMSFCKRYYESRNHYLNWNIKSIIVSNSKNVSSFLGFKIEEGADILEIDECIDFISEYKEYFNSIDTKTFKTFTELTNLDMTIIYELKNNSNVIESNLETKKISSIAFNVLGSNLDKNYNNEANKSDLLIINNVDELILKNDKIIVDGNSIYEIKN